GRGRTPLATGSYPPPSVDARKARTLHRLTGQARVNSDVLLGLNVTTPLLTMLAIANTLLIVTEASRRTQLSVAVGLIVVSALLLKEWIEGFASLLLMP